MLWSSGAIVVAISYSSALVIGPAKRASMCEELQNIDLLSFITHIHCNISNAKASLEEKGSTAILQLER